MKTKYKEVARDYMFENPGSVINQETFGKMLMPIYYTSMSTENSISGFRKCGLYPWNPDAPDYSKIGPRAARRSYSDSPLNDINIGKILYSERLILPRLQSIVCVYI